MTLKWTNKDPEEILDYPVDFSDWVVDGADIAPGVTVVQDGVSIPTGLTDLIVDNIFVTGKIVVTWLSGGTIGESYTFKITAQDNCVPVRTAVRRAKIKIKAK